MAASLNVAAHGDGVPVLALHGWSPDHRLMTGPLEPVFAARPGYRRFYPDLPALTAEEAAGLVCDAIVYRPNSITPPLAAATAGLGHVFRTPTDRLLATYYRLTR